MILVVDVVLPSWIPASVHQYVRRKAKKVEKPEKAVARK
jgi:hypothetical protein